MKTTTSLTLAALMSFAIGCDVPEIETPQAATPPAQEAAPQQEPAPLASDVEPITSEPREVTGRDPRRGQRSREAGGYLGAVGGARFYAEHQMIFLQVQQALALYNAQHGHFPKSDDEFRSGIIGANQIHLPELPEGVEYIYDPDDHKLKIYRPGDAEVEPETVMEAEN